tara:strand:+ start:744 stop:1001 length:258 start_codon:yes stop_codon:yes gene_type:complete
MAETFEDIIRKSITSFMQGKMPEATLELAKKEGKEIKYTPEYFEELEKDLMGNKEKKDNKNNKKSKEKDLTTSKLPMEESLVKRR